MLHLALADQPPAGADWAYELAAAQFTKYRPAAHRFLGLSERPFPGAMAWEPLTERLVVRAGERAGRALLPTFTRPVAGREVELDHWYTTWHVPEVLTVPGYAAGQRFARHGDNDLGPDEPTRLALYELDAADLAAALDALQDALGAMHPTTALDPASIASWCFVPWEAPAQ